MWKTKSIQETILVYMWHLFRTKLSFKMSNINNNRMKYNKRY